MSSDGPSVMEDIRWEKLDPVSRAFLNNCISILTRKNRDYTQGNSDRLVALKKVATEAGVTVQKVIWIFMRKHLDAIQRYCSDGELDSEGLTSRLTDIVNYMVLMHHADVQHRDEHGDG